jgi:aspartyl-tRNA(Asn)/glutamyl-tRNA(Gln) amidotransferase subunit A
VSGGHEVSAADVQAAVNAVVTTLSAPPDVAARGPLAGLRVGLKDNIDTAGVRTTCASRFFADRVPDRDADVVARLRAAGAQIVAKLNLAEFAVGVTSQNSAAGPCRNPWDPRRVPGGSSGGSGAAVAAGLVDLALGTDTGGSVRLPAAMNGVTGLRPTVGTVSNDGVFPVCPAVDTVGPLARTVGLVARAHRVLAGSGASDASPAAPRRIGVPEQLLTDVDPGVREVFEALLAEFRAGGAEIVPVRVPGILDAQELVYTLVYADLAVTHRERIERSPELFHPDTLQRFRLGLDITAAERAAAVAGRSAVQARLDTVFADVDALLTPTLPVDVPLAGPGDVVAVSRRLGFLTYPWSLHAGPTLALPAGLHPSSGMPVGVQLTGPVDGEEGLFAVGAWYQSRTAWHDLRPPLCLG